MSDSVVVGVRVRPLNSRETGGGKSAAVAWRADGAAVEQVGAAIAQVGAAARRPHSFSFDAVFDKGSSNEEVYDGLAAPVVEAALGGFNATVFAYGQTSSGKTHSMLGTDDDPGVTPRAIQHVLRVAEASKTRQFLIRVAYVEIYNDKIRDLMNPTRSDLAVREDKAGRVFIDAEETVVETLEEAMAVLIKGQTSRHVGETKMNARSSRSHTVFSLQIESRGGDGIDQSFRASSLNLVDLAGSERMKSTGAEGARAKEGAHINKSLLVLGTIINRLSSSGGDSSKVGHLPYRDSKLTRLLRPALGGNAKTAVLCAMTPSMHHVEETLSTLKFAERAKKVTTNATRNEVVDYRSKYKEAAVEVAMLRERFALMEAEVANMRTAVARGGGNAERVGGEADSQNAVDAVSPSSSFTDASSTTNSHVGAAVKEVRLGSGAETAAAIAVSVELQASREEVKYLKEHVDEVETENEHMREQLKKKTADFRGLRTRALELRSAARKARGSERAVRRTLILAFEKLEEARAQLEISRKKGAHVKLAESSLEDLSKNLRSWLPASALPPSPGVHDMGSTESLTPPASESLDEGEHSLRGSGPDVSRVTLAPETGRSGPVQSSAESRLLEEIDQEDLRVESFIGATVPEKVKRRPRSLPEELVADIDDSEAEVDDEESERRQIDGVRRSKYSSMDDASQEGNTRDGIDLEDDHDVSLSSIDMLEAGEADAAREEAASEKPKKKPKGWKAFKQFYGYSGSSVYDAMMGGHRATGTSKSVSTR